MLYSQIIFNTLGFKVLTQKKLLLGLLFACMTFMQGMLLAHDHDSHQAEPESCFSCLHKLSNLAVLTAEQELPIVVTAEVFEQQQKPDEALLSEAAAFLARAPPHFPIV